MSRFAVFTEMGPWSASTRFRALQFVPGLRSELGSLDVWMADDQPRPPSGATSKVRYFASHAGRYARRAAEVSAKLKEYDGVLVQRGFYPLGPDWVAQAVKRYTGQVVFDLDDDVFSVKPALAVKGPAARWLYGAQQARALVDRADSIVVSTPILAASLPEVSGAVTVLPTVPDPKHVTLAQHTAANRRIVWAGTSGGLGYLDPLNDIFADLAKAGSELVVVSSAPWQGPSSFRQWKIDEELTLFSQFAVGIMPLPDTQYTRAKAGFKLLQYMCAGLPVVASPVGVNAELVTASGSGFLASTPVEWRDALMELLDDPALRARMGAAGRAFVEGYADIEGHVGTISGLLSPR